MVGGCFSTCPSSPVPFWDEKLQDLSLQPLSLADPAHYHLVKVPSFKSTFDLYNPNGSEAYPTARTPIIPRDVADTEGRTYVATLRFDSLGFKAKCRRAVWKKYRVLYVGCLPNMQEKA